MRFIKLIIPICISLTTKAQVEKIKSWKLSEEVSAVAVDRPGDIYLTTLDGQIHRYDQAGAVQSVYKQSETPTLFDPHDGARLFAFYRAKRTCAYLTPSFNISTSTLIDSAFAIDPWLACPSGDHNVWVIDAVDRSLKRINSKSGQVEAEAKLDASVRIADINFMREYQGFLFMLYNHCKIMVYNSLGNLVKAVESKEINCFNFLGEELYYLEDGRLKFLDLFSAETREITLPFACTFALLTDEHLILVNGKAIDIFKFKQQ